jgi:hypothetical protein
MRHRIGRAVLVRWRRVALVASLVGGLAALGACSDDGPEFVDSDLPPVISAISTDGVLGTWSGSVTIDGRVGDVSGSWSGADLATDGRATVTGEIPFEEPVPIDLVVRDASVGSQRSEVAATSSWPVTLVGGQGNAPEVMAVTFLRDALLPFHPPTMLEALIGDEPERSAGDEIEGRSTTRLRFPLDAPLLGRNVQVDVFVSAGDRLERIRVEFDSADSAVVVDYRTTLTDRGPVDATLPDVTTTTIEPLRPLGDYVELRSGTAPELEWRLLRAPGREGIECWRVETTPGVVVKEPNADGGARCIASDDPADIIEERIVAVLNSDGSPGAAILVVRVPDGFTDVILGFAGGRTVPASVDAGVIVWAGDAESTPVYVEAADSSGSAVACALGAIESRADLDDPDALRDASFARSPWVCFVV